MTLTASSSNVPSSAESYEWFGPNSFTSDQSSVMVDEGGTYTVVLTNTLNGCTSQEITEVVVDQESNTIEAETITSTELIYTIDPSNYMNDPNCTYEWLSQNGLTVTSFPLAEINQTGTYTFVKTNNQSGCLTEYIYGVQFSINTVADAGSDQLLSCNTPTVVLGSTSTSTGSNYTYTWTSQGNLVGTSPSIEVSDAGTYILTVFNIQNNISDSDTVSINSDFVIPDITVSTPAVLTCDEQSTILIGTSATFGVTFEWLSPNNYVIANQPVIEAEEAGTYTLTIENTANGCTATQDVTVEQNIDGGNFDIEAIQSSQYPFSLTADDFPTGLNLQFAWTPATGLVETGTFTADLSQPGQYEFVATNEDTGCDYIYTYTIYNNILADAGLAQTLTCVTNSVTLDGSASSMGANITYEWSGPDGFLGTSITQEATIDGIYTLQVTDVVTGESFSDQVLVYADIEEPMFELEDPAPLTFEQPLVLLEANLFTPSISDATFAWFNDIGQAISNTQNIEADLPGIYTLTVTNTINGCSAMETAFVSQDFASEIIALETMVSSTFPIEIDPRDMIDGIDGIVHQPFDITRSMMYEHKWVEREGLTLLAFPIAQISKPGLYAFLRRDSLTNFVTRYEYNIMSGSSTIVADAGPNQMLDCNNSSLTLEGANTSTGAIFSYAWTNQKGTLISSDNQIEVNEAGIYTLTVTNNDTGEQASDTVEVSADFVAPTVSVATPDPLDCVNAEVTLEVSTTIPSQSTDIQWIAVSGSGIISDPTSEAILINEAGVYTVEVTNLENGCSTIKEVIVNQTEAISLLAEPFDVSCHGAADGTVNILVTGGTPPYLFSQALDGELAAGIYELDVDDSSGCSESISFTINEPEAIALDIMINSNEQIEAMVSGGVGAYTYDWNIDETTAIIENPEEGFEYILTVTDANGCAITESFIYQTNSIWTPNARSIICTPNPTDGYLSLKIDDTQAPQITALYLYNIQGIPMPINNKRLTSLGLELNLEDLPSGTYFLHLVIGKELFYQKIILL